MQPTYNNVSVIAPLEQLKKKDKPVLKPLEKTKRGRKKKAIPEMKIETGHFVVSFL